MSRSMGELLDEVTDRLLCPKCGNLGALIGDRRALCQCGQSWYIGPDEQMRYREDACQDCGVYPLDISPTDAVCRCGKPLFSNETRIANLERMVKRIAAHLRMDT